MAENKKKLAARAVSIVLLISVAFMLVGCNMTNKSPGAERFGGPSNTDGLKGTSGTPGYTSAPLTKQAAMKILNTRIPKGANMEFAEVAAAAKGTGKYLWDDGTYYTFVLKNKAVSTVADLRNMFLVNKNTREVYLVDLAKDAKGNVLRKYMVK